VNKINNNTGASFILFTIMMGAILLALLGAVFGSMYNAQNSARKLRAGINSHQILQQLGVITLQAYKYHQSGTCPAGTDETNHFGFGGVPIFCFPDDICVPHPISNDATDMLCEDSTQMFEPMPVNQGVASIDIDLPVKQKFNLFVHKIDRYINKSIQYIISKSSYLTDKLSAEIIIPVSFAGASAPTTLNVNCTGTLCKECSLTPGTPTASNLPCMRFRVCPRLGGCNAGNDNEWVVQKIGVLVGPAAP